MPHVATARKVFNFVVEIDGVNQFEVQTVEFPELSVEVTEHGGSNYTVNTPGLRKTGRVKLEKIKPMTGSDDWAWNWFNAGQDPFVGGGALSGDLKRLVVIRELDASGLAYLDSWYCEGCFIATLGQNQYSRTSSDNIMQSVEIAVDRIRKI